MSYLLLRPPPGPILEQGAGSRRCMPPGSQEEDCARPYTSGLRTTPCSARPITWTSPGHGTATASATPPERRC